MNPYTSPTQYLTGKNDLTAPEPTIADQLSGIKSEALLNYS